MIVNKDFSLAAYYEARKTLDHSDAVEQVAALCGHQAETIEEVVLEEAMA
jgi:hypothetical protein